ncbi:MAG: GGDEF domain-containing protein [Pseudomonadota bacterium]
MAQVLQDQWSFILFGLIFTVTCAQMLIVYVLADSSKPPAGLGLYTVYFMASLLGWIALTLQKTADLQMAVNLPSIMIILNSFILYMAACQRANINTGRYLLGSVCLAAALCEFFLQPEQMFMVQGSAVTLFFVATGLICGLRAWRLGNVGDAIIASAALIMVIGTPVAMTYAFAADIQQGEMIAFGAHSISYTLVVLGFLASVVIEYQQHLSNLATLDPLTRLLNRRGMEDALQISMAQASRANLPTSAIMVDVDQFKGVNDSFGHDVGDHVLRQIAEVIARLCRSSDVVARTGGEEFLLILPDTDLDAARILAERIRVAIGERPLLVDSQRIGVTVSLGVASIIGATGLDELTQEADRALYLAKQGGRNRVASVEHKPIHLSTAQS